MEPGKTIVHEVLFTRQMSYLIIGKSELFIKRMDLFIQRSIFQDNRILFPKLVSLFFAQNKG